MRWGPHLVVQLKLGCTLILQFIVYGLICGEVHLGVVQWSCTGWRSECLCWNPGVGLKGWMKAVEFLLDVPSSQWADVRAGESVATRDFYPAQFHWEKSDKSKGGVEKAKVRGKLFLQHNLLSHHCCSSLGTLPGKDGCHCTHRCGASSLKWCDCSWLQRTSSM